MSLRRVSFAIGLLVVGSTFAASMPLAALPFAAANFPRSRMLTPPASAFTTAPPGIICGGDAFFPGGSPLGAGQVTDSGDSEGMTVLTPSCDSPSGGPMLGSYVTWEKVSGADGSCVQVPTTHVYLIRTKSNPGGGEVYGTTQFSVEVEGGSGGCSCGSGSGADGAGFGYAGSGAGGGCVGCEGNSAHGPLMSLGSARVRMPLGFIDNGHPLGVLRLEEESTGGTLGDLSHLQFDQADYFTPSVGGVEVVLDSGNFRQIRTPELLADIVPDDMDPNNATPLLYTVTLYRHWSGGSAPYTGSDAFRSWEISRLSTTQLQIDDSILTDGGMDMRARYVYEHVSSPANAWTLTSYASDGSTVLQMEVLTDWASQSPDAFSRAVRKRTYTVYNATPAEVFKSDEYQTEYEYLASPSTSAWRRTKLVVDPGMGKLNRTTQWTYSVDGDARYSGLVVQSVRKPDGAWTWYRMGPCITLDSSLASNPGDPNNTDWLIQEISGLEDTALDPNSPPSPRTDGTRTVSRVYKLGDADLGGDVYALRLIEMNEGSTLVSRSKYERTGNHEVTCSQSIDGGSSWLASLMTWEEGPSPEVTAANRRITRLAVPGRAIMEYSESVIDMDLSAGYPDPHVPKSGTGYTLHETTRKSSADSYVVGKSTREQAITDAAGRVWFRQSYVCDNMSPTWTALGWTASVYDVAGRLIDTWQSNGRRTEINHPSCCTTETKDEDGIETTVERDVLGRTTSVSRNGVTTATSYSTARQETITRSGTAVTSLVTKRYRDAAGRPIRIDNASGADGELRTFIEYGTSGSGGLKTITYRDYLAAASAGTPGTRDEIREYWPDGRLQSVTGAAVVESYYTYGIDSPHLRKTKVETGPGGDRCQITYTDMLGRTSKTERPGWDLTTPPTLTTTYTYDDPDTGLLLSVASPERAPTIYEYDGFGQVKRTALDLNHNGLFDDSTDRITESDWLIDEISSDWWRISTSAVYPPGSSTPLITSTSRVRLTGFAGNVVGESKSIDIAGNESDVLTEINRGSATRTVTTTVPESGTPAT